MEKEIEIKRIIIPKGAETDIELGLVTLTEFLTKSLNLDTSFGLGGEYGYGVEFENDTFMMHPYCWCDKSDCGWCSMIGTTPKIIRDLEDMSYANSGRLPNFLYKPTQAKIWWYKWIGRDQEQDGDLPSSWLKECIDSIKSHAH